MFFMKGITKNDKVGVEVGWAAGVNLHNDRVWYNIVQQVFVAQWRDLQIVWHGTPSYFV